MGKGSKRRPGDDAAYAANYARIFGGAAANVNEDVPASQASTQSPRHASEPIKNAVAPSSTTSASQANVRPISPKEGVAIESEGLGTG